MKTELKTRISHWSIYLLVVMICFLLSHMVNMNIQNKVRFNVLYTPMIDASLQIKLKGTTAHLWFEEMLGGERDEDIEIILDILDQADRHAETLLNGKTGLKETISPLDDPEFHQDINSVRNKLKEFRDITRKRFEAKAKFETESDINKRYHSIFTVFIQSADKLRAKLDQIMEQDLQNFQSKQFLLLMTCLLMALLMGVVFFFFERFRKRNIKLLHITNTHLENEIVERKQAEKELSGSREELRNLNNRLQVIREEEKTRISREIHDELGQALTALKFSLSLIEGELSHEKQAFREKIHSMSELVDSTVKSVQRITMELRPQILDVMGLCEAFEWQTEEYQDRTNIQCSLSCNINKIDLDRDRSTALFRILQEALTNVARHSKATHIQISFNKGEGFLVLEIKDNGKGIDEEQIHSPKSLGLLGIRERVQFFEGEVNIQGIAGKGTTVTAKIPYNPKYKLENE